MSDERAAGGFAKPEEPGRRQTALIWAAQSFCLLFVLGTIASFLILLWPQSLPWAKGLYIFAFLCFCLAFYFLYKGRRRERRSELLAELDESKNHIQQIQLQKRQEQLNALQSQINPHFLYNTLDTIRGLALEKESPEIANIVAALASMFKYSMDYSSPRVTVMDEISHLEQYLKIQAMRFPGKFEFESIYECPHEVLYKVLIPKLTLQPIVENAISHGLKSRMEGGKITLRFILSDYAFSIIVSDNGTGISEEMALALNRSFRANHIGTENKDTPQFGIALANIDLRIKLYCGEDYGLQLVSTQNLGTDVTITLPPLEAPV